MDGREEEEEDEEEEEEKGLVYLSIYSTLAFNNPCDVSF
jgi:hypothetical protein